LETTPRKDGGCGEKKTEIESLEGWARRRVLTGREKGGEKKQKQERTEREGEVYPARGARGKREKNNRSRMPKTKNTIRR